MPNMKRMIVPLALLVFSSVAWADHDKDESGKGRHGYKHGEHKEEYWDGNCKVKSKWKKDGEYKEERKCKGPDRYGDQDYRYRQLAQPTYRYREPVVEQRTYYPAQDNYERREPRVDVDVRIRP
jgi:hypothetical protein